MRGGDILLLLAIAVGGLGYAEGGALAREYGGWRVICWAVILALPVTVPVTIAAAMADPPRHLTAAAVAGLAYVSLVSMGLGFFAWYAGLARGGVARIGRLQLAQPALTLGWSALLLGEQVSLLAAVAAAAVIGATAIGRNARVDRPAAERPAHGSGAIRWPARDRETGRFRLAQDTRDQLLPEAQERDGRGSRGGRTAAGHRIAAVAGAGPLAPASYGGGMPDRKEILEVAGARCRSATQTRSSSATGHTKLTWSATT